MTKSMSLCWIVCAVSLLAAGCASNRQFVDIPDLNARVQNPGKGRVYVLRPSGMAKAASMEVWDGSVHIGNTGPKSFLCWERDPGEAIVSGREENVSTVSVWVQAQETYYILQHLRMGWVAARNELEVIGEAQAEKLLKKCKAPTAGKCQDHPECRSELGGSSNGG